MVYTHVSKGTLESLAFCCSLVSATAEHCQKTTKPELTAQSSEITAAPNGHKADPILHVLAYVH